MNKVRIGLIGCGTFGSGYVSFSRFGLIQNAELVAVCDTNPKQRAWAKAMIPSLQVFESMDELMDPDLVDAVIITTPHYTHPPIAIKALEKGLHVLVEKPAGVYTKQVRELNKVASEHPDQVFAIMLNQRTNCVYRKIREMVQSGELGSLKRVSWMITDWYRPQLYYDAATWRGTWKGDGGGVLLNQSPHQLDLLLWICGMPRSVRAFCHEGKWHDTEVEDDVTAYMEFPNGATGTFITSTGDAPGVNRLEIVLSKGTIKCENEKDLSVYVLDEDEREYCLKADNIYKAPSGHFVEVETDGRNEQHQGVVNAFVSKILGTGELVARGEEGLDSVMLINALYLSSWTGRTVEIPFDEDLYLALLNRKAEGSNDKK